jgi:hypothetical protein
MEASLALFYASGATFAVLGALVLIHDFLRLITGRLSDDELTGGSGGEEASHHPSRAA